MSAPVTERRIELRLKRAVKQYGGFIRKVVWQGVRGAPDRFVCVNGAACWVELKAPGQKPGRRQAREHDLLRRHGLRAEVVDSLERADLLIKELADSSCEVS